MSGVLAWLRAWRASRPAPQERCICWYDGDGGPYGLPHWVISPSCPQHGREVLR